MTDPITVLGNLTSGPGEHNQQTHYPDCWRDPAHHACALKRIGELQTGIENLVAACERDIATARAEALEEAAKICDGYAKVDNPHAVTISLMTAHDIRALKDRRP